MTRRIGAFSPVALLLAAACGSTDGGTVRSPVTGDSNPGPGPGPAPVVDTGTPGTPPLGEVIPPSPEARAACEARWPKAENPLPIEVTATNLPVVVGVTGSPELLARVAEFEAKRNNCETGWSWGTHGFGFDWGDDPDLTRQDFDDQPKLGTCTDMRRHAFSVPGTYRIRASLFHPGPTDAIVTDWAAEKTVTIAGAAAPPELTLLPGLDGQRLHYQASPEIRWQWKPDRALAIEVALVKLDGAVVQKRLFCPSAYVGEGKAMLSLAGDEADQHLRNGPITAKARVRLFDGTHLVVERTSGELTYSPEFDPAFEPPVLASLGSRRVSVTFRGSHPDCLSYSIDWGDGSASDVVEKTAPSSGCRLSDFEVKREHTYAAAGMYAVKVKSNRFNPFKPLADVVAYHQVSAAVP